MIDAFRRIFIGAVRVQVRGASVWMRDCFEGREVSVALPEGPENSALEAAFKESLQALYGGRLVQPAPFAAFELQDPRQASGTVAPEMVIDALTRAGAGRVQVFAAPQDDSTVRELAAPA